jgi:hypothetical protein
VGLEPLRVLTIERLTCSWQASVPVMLAAEVDARALLARKADLSCSDPPPSLTALVASVLAPVVDGLCADPDLGRDLRDGPT